MPAYVPVPHGSLSEGALEALIEEFVSREGTDYGPVEHSFEQKKASVLRLLHRGEVSIVFDLEAESATIVTREELAAHPADDDGDDGDA